MYMTTWHKKAGPPQLSRLDIPIISMSEQRARRYGLAMTRCPQARYLELYPIAGLTTPVQGALLDMLAGDGFVSRVLGPAYNRVDAVDQLFTAGEKVIPFQRAFTRDAGSSDLGASLDARYDTIISLAGFHHILPPDPAQSDNQSIDAYRVACLSSWRELLNPCGRLIIADVPVAGESILSPALTAFPGLAGYLTELPHTPPSLTRTNSLEPARFFDEFVAKRSITSHEARFESSTRMSRLLRQAGFVNIKVHVASTPWRFADMQEMLWFLHQLFGIDEQSYGTPEELPQPLALEIIKAADLHLGIYQHDDYWWLGWKLLYAYAERPA